jgi:hypothetical protein
MEMIGEGAYRASEQPLQPDSLPAGARRSQVKQAVSLSRKEHCRILKVLEDAGGRMARAEKNFKSPIVLRGMPNYYGYLYT